MTTLFDAEQTVPQATVATVVSAVPGYSVADVGGRSVQGSTRIRNEDAWGFRGGDVFVVADGIGGRLHGDVAARATIESLLVSLSNEVLDWRTPMQQASEAVMAATALAIPTPYDVGRTESTGPGGAVAAALRSFRGRVSLVHVGDARAYRIRDGVVEPLTRDHSIREVMADLGVRRCDSGLPDRELASITSFFGESRSWEEFTVRELTVRPNDRIVLCTDGCYGLLASEDWESVRTTMSAHDAASLLIDHAVTRGTRDDATAVVVDFDGERHHSQRGGT
ncbi:MAG: PP2C family serine/threonine-protein phosphatase [Ilumatobacter sp.]